MGAVIRETRSVCPVCLQNLPAALTKETDVRILLEKRCPEHGAFRVPVWQGKTDWESWLLGTPPLPEDKGLGCPENCGICAEPLSADALDEIVFADPAVVDCRYEQVRERLLITALTNGASDEAALLPRLRAVCPGLRIVLTARPAGPEEHALYIGKRTISRQLCPPGA